MYSFDFASFEALVHTARKLTVIIWNMVVKEVPYINPEGYLFLDQKRKLGLVKRIKKHPVTYGTVSPKTIWASKQLKFKTFEVR